MAIGSSTTASNSSRDVRLGSGSVFETRPRVVHDDQTAAASHSSRDIGAAAIAIADDRTRRRFRGPAGRRGGTHRGAHRAGVRVGRTRRATRRARRRRGGGVDRRRANNLGGDRGCRVAPWRRRGRGRPPARVPCRRGGRRTGARGVCRGRRARTGRRRGRLDRARGRRRRDRYLGGRSCARPGAARRAGRIGCG